MKPRAIGYALLALTVLFALAPAYRGAAGFPIRTHHLLHALMLVGAALSGLLVAQRPVPLKRRGTWLVISIVAPMLAMLLMWPSEYSPLEKLAAAHVVEHLGLVLLGFVTAYAGQLYAYGVGTAMTLSLWMMAFLAVWGFGVSPPLQVTADSVPQQSTRASLNAPPDLAHGKAVFAQNCAACHGAQGQGGMGPRLIAEATRKNLEQTVTWIRNPAPPMPKLYPASLSAQDVRDVAAYVESLK